MPDPRREQIMAIIKTDLEAMTVVDNGWAWDVVRRAPLTSLDRRKTSALGLRVVNEQKRLLTGVGGRYDCYMNVRFEFYVLLPKDDEPDTVLTGILSSLHALIRASTTQGGSLDGLAIDAEEVSNELLVDSSTDRQLEGFFTVQYHYRHKDGDTTQPR